MLKIYGVSDDTVEIHDIDGNKFKSIYCDNLKIKFEDGTIIKIIYTKSPSKWDIKIVKLGRAFSALHKCDFIPDKYSDVFVIESSIKSIKSTYR